MILPSVNLAHIHITLNPNFLPHTSKDLVFSHNAKYNPISKVPKVINNSNAFKVHKDHLSSKSQGNVFTMSSYKIENKLDTFNIK